MHFGLLYERSSQRREWFASSLVLPFTSPFQIVSDPPISSFCFWIIHPPVSDRNSFPVFLLPITSPLFEKEVCVCSQKNLSLIPDQMKRLCVSSNSSLLDSSPWVRVFIFNSHIDRLHLWQTKSCIDFAWVAVRCRLEKYGSLRITSNCESSSWWGGREEIRNKGLPYGPSCSFLCHPVSHWCDCQI